MSIVLSPHVTPVDVVRLLTADPATEFTTDQLDAIHGAKWLGYITITDSPLRPTLADGITYCATCLIGCDHNGDASCEHSGCWGSEASNACPGRKFERMSVTVMTAQDWATAGAQ
jgi:hypothetical protein